MLLDVDHSLGRKASTTSRTRDILNNKNLKIAEKADDAKEVIELLGDWPNLLFNINASSDELQLMSINNHTEGFNQYPSLFIPNLTLPTRSIFSTTGVSILNTVSR